MCYFMWNVLFMYNVLCAYLGQWHIWLCILLMYNSNVYAVIVSIYMFSGPMTVSVELLKSTCILRYELQHNEIKLFKSTCILRYKLLK
jgi:hypothetical protein